MVQAATDCSKLDYCQKEYGFAVAVGTISLFCAIVFAILERTNLPIAQKMAMPLSIFLYFFNTVGACECDELYIDSSAILPLMLCAQVCSLLTFLILTPAMDLLLRGEVSTTGVFEPQFGLTFVL
jgi:hypothetical protein